jgi:hypothetical protein
MCSGLKKPPHGRVVQKIFKARFKGSSSQHCDLDRIHAFGSITLVSDHCARHLNRNICTPPSFVKEQPLQRVQNHRLFEIMKYGPLSTLS